MKLIDVDDLKVQLTQLSEYPTYCNTVVDAIGTIDRVTRHDIEDILEEYKDSIKLLPNICVNCGGGIDRETMLCRFCGTSYRI